MGINQFQLIDHNYHQSFLCVIHFESKCSEQGLLLVVSLKVNHGIHIDQPK